MITRVGKNYSLICNLVSGVKNKDKKHQELFYKSFYGYLLGIAIRYMGDRFQAQEVVNDSFVKAFNKIQFFELIGNQEDENKKALKGWLARIVVNTALDKLRRNNKLVFLDDLSAVNFSENGTEISTKLNADDILKIINQLPDMHRIIFNLYEIEGFSHKEITLKLNIPESTSRVYLSRAKLKLKELYLLYFPLA